jgi:hypothetical protein
MDTPMNNEERGLEYRHWIMLEVERLMKAPDKPHLFDVLYKLKVPRALFLANASHPAIAKWLQESEGRLLLHPVPGGLPDLGTIKESRVVGMSMAGLDTKLEQVIAQADPTTEEGRRMIVKLAELQAKMLPKTIETTERKVPEEDILAELKAAEAKTKRLLEKRAEINEQNMSDE